MNDANRENLETRVLVLAPTVKDAELTRAILDRAGIACFGCPDPAQLCEQLTEGAAAVLLAEEAVHGGDGCLAEWLDRQPPWSDLPVLILAQAGADSVAVAGAIDKLGNVTVLERPVRVAALVSAVRSAMRARQRQYQLRNDLVQRERLAEERDRAMAALQETSEHLRLALSAAKASAFSWDIPKNEVHRIDAVATILSPTNGTPDTFEGVLTKIHPDDRSRFEGRVWAALSGAGVEYHNEYRVVEPTGTARWITDVGRVEYGPDGGPVRLTALAIDETKRKEAEATLQASQDRFRLAADAVNGVIYEYDFASGHVERSRGLYEVLGYQTDEVPPTALWWHEQVHPDDRDPAYRQFEELVASGNRVVTEYRVRHKDGRWLHVEDRAVVVKDTSGTLVKMVGCTVDVTERAEAEERLRYSERLHRVAFDHSPTGMAYVGTDGRFIKVNSSMCEIAGYPAEELVGMRASDLTHLDDRARDAELANPVLRGDTPTYKNDKRYVRKDGGVRWVSIIARMVTDAEGRPLHSVGVVLDITDRKRVEQALADRTMLLNGVLEGTTDVIFVKDLNGRILLANAACAAAGRSTPEQLVGKTDEELFPPDVAAAIRERDEAVLASGLPVQFEESIPLAGEPRVCLTLKAPLRDGNGRVVGLLGISRDITERNRTEEALREHAEILSQVSDTVGMIDNDERILFLNSAGEQLYRVKEADVLGRNLSALYQRRWLKPEDEAVAMATLREHGEALWELIHVTHDGRELFVQSSVSLMRDATGKVTGIIAAIRDITDRKRAEDAMTRLAAIVESSNDAIFGEDLDGIITSWNPGAEQIFGYRADEVVGTSILRLIPEARQDEEHALQQKIATGDRGGTLEAIRRAKDGREFYASITVSALKDAAGKIIGTSRVVRDITEQQKAENALLVAEKQLRLAVEVSGLGVLTFNYITDTCIPDSTAATMFGLEPGVAVPRSHIHDRFHPDDEAAIVQQMRQCLDPTGDGCMALEHRVVHPDGTTKWLGVKKQIMFGEAGGFRSPVSGVLAAVDITARKEAEEARRESETRLRLIGDNLPDSAVYQYTIDPNGTPRFIHMGAGIEQMNGVRASDVLRDARILLQQIPSDYLEEIVAAEEVSAREMSDYNREVPMCRPDGEVRWMHLRSRPRRLPDGTMVWDGVQTDITERKRADQAIRVSEARLRRVFESNVIGMIRWDLNRSLILDANAEFLRMTGYTREEVTNGALNFRTLTPPEWTERNEAGIRTLQEDGFAATYEKEYFCKDGSRVPLIIAGTRFEDSPSEGMSFLIDLSERKRAEQVLRENEARLGGILRKSPAGIVQTDAAGSMTLVNPRWCEMMGYSEAELLGRSILEITHSSFVDVTATAFGRLAAGGPDFQIEKAYSRKDGSVLRAQSNVAALRSPDGEFHGLIAVVLDISERLRSEEELRGSEQRMRLATEATSVGIWEWNVVTGQIHWDAQMFRIYSVPPTQDGCVHYDTWRDAVLPEDLPRQEEVLQETVRTRGHSRREFRIQRPGDGEYRVVQSVETVSLDEQGQVQSVVGTNLDITERKQAEIALRESEERSAFVRRSSGVGFWYCNLPFDVLEWDDLVKAHFYLPPEARVTMQTFYDHIHPDDREQTRLAIERSIAERLHYNVDYRTIDPETGATRWIRAIGRTFYDADGTPTRFDGITLDVSDQKRAQASLSESERRFREMANIAPAMIWVTNEKHECTFLSQSWLEFTGQRSGEGLGSGWLDAVHPDDRDAAKASFIYAATNGEPFKFDYRLRTKDGNYRWAIDAGKPRFNEEGEFTGFVGSIIDDHDRHVFQLALNEALVKAESSNESKSAFLANMSHEIRTPMTAILGYVDLLKDLVNQDDGSHYLQTIRNNGYFLLDIINDILDLSKIEAGKMDIDCQLFEPQRVIADVRNIMDIRAKEGGLTLEVHYEGRQPRIIHSDAKRLKQILINLVGNAIKFTHHGTVQIRVRFDAMAQRLQFTITDTGIGISPDQMEKLFVPFSQGDASVSRKFGGTGLGLIISQRLAEMLDGSITVTSTKGVGSTFSVTIATGKIDRLDLVDCDSLLIETKTQSLVDLNALTKLTCHVLVVDDRRDIRFLSRHLLTKAGATVEECHDGLLAVEHISACINGGRVPDLILLDMQMPNLDGYATARRLRSLGFTRPIVALTADAMQSDMAKCLEAGCNDYLSKPIDNARLLKKVAELTKGDDP